MRMVLLVDADPLTTEPLTYLLEQAEFTVTVATSGPEALAVMHTVRPDIVLLDWQLQDAGEARPIAVILRQTGAVPIIVVTSADSEQDKVTALELGVDDYVVKPFSSRELIARMTAVLRRVDTAGQDPGGGGVLSAGQVRIDIDRHRVTVDGARVELRLKEFVLLEFLVRNSNRVLNRGELGERLWGDRPNIDPKRIDVLVKGLREAIEPDPAEPRHLLTVRGIGYRFQP